MKNRRHLRKAGEAQFKDRFTTKANELLVHAESTVTGKYGIVGFPLSKSSISHSGASQAPDAIRTSLASFSTYSGETGVDLTDELIDFGDVLMHPTDIQESQRRMTTEFTSLIKENSIENWFLLGGDHGISYSTIKAIAEEKSIGILQFDAHHDLRNTEYGGPTNGTPFRRLLADKIITGEQITQIGIRDFMNAKAYEDYAKEEGITVYTMQAVEDMGMESILEKELARLSVKFDLIYLSVDMDVLDQAFAPGCPAIGPGGMDSKTLIRGIEYAAKHPSVSVMDIVEIDPTIDFRNMTSRLAAYLLLTYMKAKSAE